MFVPVACLKCGKLFQVPEAAAGTEVVCPWCNASTPALPVAAVPAESTGEPLSLDDAHPVGTRPVERRRMPAPSPALTPLRVSYRTIIAAIVLVVIVTGATIAVLGYRSGRIPSTAWSEFTPPDASCAVALPGTPVAERVEPNPADGVTRGGERYAVSGWYSGTTVWVGWQDLDPGWAKQAMVDRDGALTTPVLEAELNRRKSQLGGTVTKEGAVRFGSYAGREVQMDTPRGQLIERFVVAAEGSRPRLYFLGFEAKAAAPDGPVARKLFNSFRVNKE